MAITIDQFVRDVEASFEGKYRRASAIIEMLRIFYPNQVERAEKLADLAMRTPDNTRLVESETP